MKIDMNNGCLYFTSDKGTAKIIATDLHVKQKELVETSIEWEEKCNKCGSCCEYRYFDTDTETVLGTGFFCKYFDEETKLCRVFNEKNTIDGGCGQVTPHNYKQLSFPSHCAYMEN